MKPNWDIFQRGDGGCSIKNLVGRGYVFFSGITHSRMISRKLTQFLTLSPQSSEIRNYQLEKTPANGRSFIRTLKYSASD